MLNARSRKNLKLLVNCEARKRAGLDQKTLRQIEGKQVRVMESIDKTLDRTLGWKQ